VSVGIAAIEKVGDDAFEVEVVGAFQTSNVRLILLFALRIAS
jgi:hypothetical protein